MRHTYNEIFNTSESTKLAFCSVLLYFTFDLTITPRREWADPGGTAIPGQPVGKSEQALASSPSAKNHFNIDVP